MFDFISETIDSVRATLKTVPPWAYLALTGAVTGIVATSWGKIKGWFVQLSTHLVALDMLDSDLVRELVNELLKAGAKPSMFGKRWYFVSKWPVRSAGADRWVGFRGVVGINVPITFWRRVRWFLWLPITISKDGSDTLTVRYPRGSWGMEDFVRRAVGRANDRLLRSDRRFRVVRLMGTSYQERAQQGAGSNEKGPSACPPSSPDGGFSPHYAAVPITVPFSDLGYPEGKGGSSALWLDGDAQVVIEDAKRWNGSRQWYVDRGLSWRRGYLLHGPPGSGKTSLARAIAVDLDLPVFLFDIGSMSNQDLSEAWSRMVDGAPCMAVIEDVDAVYEGRRPVKVGGNEYRQSPPSFDWLLNLVDGVEQMDGVLLVVTTNDMSRVDEALGGRRRVDGSVSPDGAVSCPRPGRIDRVACLSGRLPEEGRLHIAKRILRERDDLIRQAVKGGASDTPARFQERCVRIALADREGVKPDMAGLDELPVRPFLAEPRAKKDKSDDVLADLSKSVVRIASNKRRG